MPNKIPRHFPGRQSGVSGILLAFLIIIVGVGFAVATLRSNSHSVKLEHEKATYRAMANAKDALIGFAVANAVRGFLPCPADPTLAGTPTEGTARETCNSVALRIGRLPWRTLGLEDLRDGNGEALWYAVSGSFTNDAAEINRATNVSTLSVNGAVNATAIIFSVGATMGTQQRNTVVAACATTGNMVRQDYCATNYLDTDLVTGVSNADADTIFAQTRANTFNDILLTISAGQFFEGVEKRVLQQVRACLRTYASSNGSYPWAHVDATGYISDVPHPEVDGKLIGRIPDQAGWSMGCPLPAGGAKSWLMDWHELVFYAVASEYAPGVPGETGSLIVNGTPNVRAVVMLAGAVLPPSQNRSDAANRGDLVNYLEGNNVITGTTTFGNLSPSSSPLYNDRLLIVAP